MVTSDIGGVRVCRVCRVHVDLPGRPATAAMDLFCVTSVIHPVSLSVSQGVRHEAQGSGEARGGAQGGGRYEEALRL